MNLPRLDSAAIALLRSDFRAAQWDVTWLEAHLSAGARTAFEREERIPAMMELARLCPWLEPYLLGEGMPGETPDITEAPDVTETGETAGVILTSFFTLGLAMPSELLALALPHLGVEGLTHLGLYRADNTCPFAITPVAVPVAGIAGGYHYHLLSDRGYAQGESKISPEWVMGAKGASFTLARAIPRNRRARALDLGCGAGIQALALAEHCDYVAASDISDRACHFTRFNAALNEKEIDVYCGSFFEPFAGQRFNIIVTNPPFVITPRTMPAGNHSDSTALFHYRDGGLGRDHLGAQIVEDGADHLEPSGTLHMLTNWEVTFGQPWHAHPEAWLQGHDYRAWVVRRDELSPAQYAHMWLTEEDNPHGGRGVSSFEARFQAWLADFDAARTTSVVMGEIHLARVSQPERDLLLESALEGGPISAREVEAHLRALPEDLFAQHYRVAGDVTEERHYLPGSEHPAVITLTSGETRRSYNVSAHTAGLVGASDGQLSAGAIAAALAEIYDEDESHVRALLTQELPMLIRAGVLLWGQG